MVEGGGKLRPGHSVGLEAVKRAVAVGGQAAGLRRPLLVLRAFAMPRREAELVQPDLVGVHPVRVGEINAGDLAGEAERLELVLEALGDDVASGVVVDDGRPPCPTEN